MEQETRNDRLLRYGWRSWLTLYAAWTIPVLVVVAGYLAIGGAAPGETFKSVLLRQIAFYYFFASICPAVYRLTGRFPFSRGRWPGSVLVHVAMVPFALSAELVLSATASFLTRGEGATLGEAIVTEFTSAPGQWRALVNIFYYSTVLGAMTLIRQSRHRRLQEKTTAALTLRASRLETQVTQARLQALEMQLNPHFLFNALNSVASLVQRRRNDDAYRAVELLGELLRETLAGDRHRLIPLRAELRFLERYLELEGIRFSDRLRTSFTVDDGCHEATVPVMILQPLVENAIRHAVAVRPEAGRIEIVAGRNGSRLLLEVRDDGPGLPAGWNFDDDAGVGLDNVRQRLQAHYGNAFELQLQPNQPDGVVARLALPFDSADSSPEETPRS